ncbi:Transcription factor [Penicillium capsulatum]|uniref:Transcription factor n=1 Tax=Penicillium capsulatum TaxID=69766 RepID=A0A9W9IRN0_9EURO|nr:Transcription factor [Penicillium capsulatum]
MIDPKSDNSTELWSRKKASVSTPGFLGHTSYSDVFTDNGSDLSLIGLSSPSDNTQVDMQRIQLGAQVLVLLKYLPLYRDLALARFKVWKGWSLGWPLMDMILRIIKEMWDDAEEEEPDENQRALLLSKRLFKNHTVPMEVRSDTSWQEFAAIISERWETIGLMFTFTGLAIGYVFGDDPMFKKHGWPESKSVANTAAAVGELCLQFCDSDGVINDVVCWLQLHHTSLLTTVYGDGDYRPWRKLGEMATAVFALGLHQECTDVPFFLQEMRKRTMIGAHSADKTIATFLGRPPLISWRYCDITMPLDLCCEDIVAEPEVRDAIIAKLAPDGWNQEGCLKEGAWPRVSLLASMMREKILEVSLSRKSENLAQKVEELSRELHQLYNDLPAFLHWSSDSEFKGSYVDDHLLFNLNLEFLYNDFLLYRLLAKRTKTQPDGLITTSLKILNALLSMVAKVHRYPIIGWDVAWHLCYAGLPSSGVLSADLLRRSRNQALETAQFPRSEVIQKLSVFASHLDTMIQPDEGNYKIAQQGGRAIRNVLDQVLSTPAVPFSLGRDAVIPDTEPEEIDFVGMGFLDSTDFNDRAPFLGWLEGTADGQESWMAWMDFS